MSSRPWGAADFLLLFYQHAQPPTLIQHGILAYAMHNYVDHIQKSELTIYDFDDSLWIPDSKLEQILDSGLHQLSTAGLPNRTRSKVVKQKICEVLGYPIPKSFQKTQPRFPCQNFDVYVQKSNNLQIWNEEVAADRRYVLIKVSQEDRVERVKVVRGDVIAKLDKTGTLTQKYQARLNVGDVSAELVTPYDTEHLQPIFAKQIDQPQSVPASTANPSTETLHTIATLFDRLTPLIGQTFKDVGHDQERNRGAVLHQLICQQLGYDLCPDDGSFPDIPHQLLEIKLQTAATIDLGLVRPNDEHTLDLPPIDNVVVRRCDVRYALLYGEIEGDDVTLTHLFLTTGERFFERFPQFQGNVVNKKIQIPLPADFFA